MSTARTSPPLRRLLLAAVAALVALVIAEGALRLLLPTPLHNYVWLPGIEATFHANPGVMPGVSGDARFHVGSLGVRARELEETMSPRVLCIGGSTTECLFLDGPESWPALIEEKLSRGRRPGAWVGNAGKSGHTSREHVLQVEQLLGDVPRLDLVVVLCGVNDLCLRLAEGTNYDPHFADKPGAADELTLKAFDVVPAAAANDPTLLHHTALWRLSMLLRGRDPDGYRIQDMDGLFYDTKRRMRRAAKVRIAELPDLSEALAEYRRNLTRIADIADAAHVKVLFVTQPSMWRADLPADLEALLWFGRADPPAVETPTRFYTTEAMAAGMAAYNDAMTAVARERGLPCVDLVPLVPRDTTAFYDDVHFNENGSRMVADALAGPVEAAIAGR